MLLEQSININGENRLPVKLEEINIGDHTWFPVKYEARPHFGEVTGLHPTDSMEPSISVIDLTDGGFRVVAARLCFDSEQEVKQYRKKILEDKKLKKGKK